MILTYEWMCRVAARYGRFSNDDMGVHFWVIPLSDIGVDLQEIRVWHRDSRLPTSGIIGQRFMSGSGVASSPEKMRTWMERQRYL